MVNSHILSMRAEDCEGLAMLHPFQTDPAPGRRTARLADPSSQALSQSISLAVLPAVQNVDPATLTRLQVTATSGDFGTVTQGSDYIKSLLNTPRELARRSAASLPPLRGAIRLEHVTFRYLLDGPAVLSDISLDLLAGQMIGVVGPSGSGKSTLAKLIQRLYTPDSGRILVDGIDLAMVRGEPPGRGCSHRAAPSARSRRSSGGG